MSDIDESVRNHLDRVTPEKRRRDAETLITMMARATGESPKLLGTIIGFGQYHYKYPSGREGMRRLPASHPARLPRRYI